MNDNAKIGVAVAGGYLLGRTKKARLALGLGMYLAGKKLSLDPKQLRQMITDNPVLAGLSDQVRTELVGATKSAAAAALTKRAGSLADNLRDRTQVLQGHVVSAKDEKDEPEDESEELSQDDEAQQHDGDDYEGADEEDAENADDEEEPAKTPRRKPAARQSGKTGGAPRSQAKGSSKASDDEAADRPRRKTTEGSTRSRGGSGSSGSGTARKATESSSRKAPARKTAARKTSTRGGDDA
ncbi:hypothetical protein AB0M94_14355 [Streptomyces xanthochromogenes]|uniref:hypothetical protein n=1 Tax=Streptomyces xanthochromogenes TaxID=67384 RepID=UPI00343EE004